MILCGLLDRIRDPAIFECHIDADPQNLLDKLKVASSRDPSGVVAINRECYGKQVQCLLYQHYRVPTMVGPTLPA
jgi:hypothetical protein